MKTLEQLQAESRERNKGRVDVKSKIKKIKKSRLKFDPVKMMEFIKKS